MSKGRTFSHSRLRTLAVSVALVLWFVAANGFGSEWREIKVAVDSKTLFEVLVLEPDGQAEKSRLCVLLGGGPGTRKMAEGIMRKLGPPLRERDWTVVAPVSPEGTAFCVSAMIPQLWKLVDIARLRLGFSAKKVLLAGKSNGGIAALMMATEAPGKVLGVMAVPGLAVPQMKRRRLPGLPVYFRIGDKDKLGWWKYYPSSVKMLHSMEVRLNARLLEGVGHGIDLDWADVDAWLKTLDCDVLP